MDDSKTRKSSKVPDQIILDKITIFVEIDLIQPGEPYMKVKRGGYVS